MSDNGRQSPAAEPKAEEKAPVSIEIKVKDQNENEVMFKIKSTTKLSKVFDAYCSRQSIDRGTVRFLLDGSRIQDNDTPATLDMEDGDMIEAVLEQIGGNGENGDEDVKSEGMPVKHININVKNANCDEVQFRIKRTTQLKKLMDAYHKQHGATPGTLRFFQSDSHRIQNDDTPDSLGMEDGETLEVHVEQQGGKWLPYFR